MKRRWHRLRRPMWWACLTVFLASGAYLLYYGYNLYAGERTMGAMTDELAAARAATQAESASTQPSGVAPTPVPMPSPIASTDDKFEATPTLDPLLATYRSFAAQNEDMVGWVSIEGTVVDYPVMFTPADPQKYLHMDFNGEYSFEGLPFVDARCDLQNPTQNRILYAHNMHTGRMFAVLTQYLNETFRAEHPKVRLDTLEARGVYEVIAVIQVSLRSMDAPNMRCYSLFDTQSTEDVAALNAYLHKYARVVTAEAQAGDAILTLSTCQRLGDVDRLVIMARKPAQAKQSAYPQAEVSPAPRQGR